MSACCTKQLGHYIYVFGTYFAKIGEMKYLCLACGTYRKEKLSTGSKRMLYEMLSLELENTST